MLSRGNCWLRADGLLKEALQLQIRERHKIVQLDVEVQALIKSNWFVTIFARNYVGASHELTVPNMVFGAHWGQEVTKRITGSQAYIRPNIHV